MRGLALTIFLSFWLVFAALLGTIALLPEDGPGPRLLDHVSQNGRVAMTLLESRGPVQCGEFATAVLSDSRLFVLLRDAGGQVVCAPDGLALEVARRSNDGTRDREVVETPVTSTSGRTYVVVGIPQRGFRALATRPRFPLGTLLAALVVSGLACFLLARYLARPLVIVRAASRRLAAGDLTARAGPHAARRRDEIGELVGDFDAMAARLEALVHAQTQLLSDISHELRSPLARLNVALELARRKAGEAAAADLERIEREAERMNELIGRLLALARAENAGAPPDLAAVHVDDLVRHVADDAAYEAQQQQKRVLVEAAGDAVVEVDARLIASAVDNVVRNAVRHTADGTDVTIAVTTIAMAAASAWAWRSRAAPWSCTAAASTPPTRPTAAWLFARWLMLSSVSRWPGPRRARRRPTSSARSSSARACCPRRK
jgi:two-component system sensor histidine kinase CpxA